MLRTLLIFLLSLIIALGSTVFMYKSEVDGMIQMGQDKLDEIINGEKPDDTDDPSDEEDELKVESIALDTTGVKLEFAFGEIFSAEGLKVIATYVDGSKKEIAIEDCKLVKPDTTKPGDRQVTVVYEGKSARYNVTINIKAIPTISSTPLVEIVGKNDSVPYRVEAELIDMVTPGVVKAEGYDSFVAEAPADADITGGDQYLTGYGVAWNYFGFTFTAAEKFEDTTLVLRVANSTGKSIDAGIIKMYLNFSQDENGVPSGEIPLEGYIIPADGACKWMDIVIRNVTIPEGTNTLTFETQKDNAFDIDYVDFYVGMRYVNSVVEIVDSTTIVKDLESLDTEKAFTRNDVANAHGLKPGQLFVETVSKPIDGQVTSGGTSVGAIGKGSQISTTIRVAQDSTVRILFKASSVGHGAYNVADHWNFYIDGVKINIVEVKNIEGGNQAAGQWWDWKYTNVGEINLPAGDHYFLLEVHGTDCNVDTVEFEVVSFGSFDESGTNIEDMYVPEEIPEADINIDKKGEFVFEAENLDMSNLTPSAGQIAAGVETPSGDGPATSGGMSLGMAGGGYASFTFKLNDKATIQIYGVLAHAHGGEAATFMSAKLNDTDLALSGTLPVGTGSMPYWNWANIPFGGEMELEAGEYTLTVTFLKNPNVDCFKINVLSYGEEEEGFKVTVEAETFDNEGVVTRQDMIDAGRIPAGQYMSETGNGATCICGFTAGTWFKFNVNLEEAKLIEMFLVGATDAGGYDVSTKLTLKVNGNDVVIPSGSITGSGTKPYWDWQTVSLGKFNLNAGDNEIILTIVDGHPNLDKVFFVEASEEPVTPPAHECESVCPECGKCLDAECAEDACAEKCEGHQVVVTPDITINDASDSYKVEAEKLDMSTLVPQTGFAKPVEESFDGGKGLGGIGSGGYQSFIVTTEKDVKVNLYISFANAGGGSILSFIPAVSVNDQPLSLIDSQVPAGIGSPQESPSNFYWNVSKVHIAVVELKAGETYTFKISVNSGNLDGYVLEVVPSHVHTEETIAAVAPTCTATGLTEGKKCSECGEILVAQQTIDALGHTEAIDAAVAATCTATGLTEGKHCSVCSEVLVAQTETPKIPHVYDEGDAFDSTCNVCGGVRTCEHANVETVPAKAATCTEPGLTEGKKCSACGDVLVAQQTVNALGHTEVVDAAVAATCTATGLTEGKHCSVCSDVLVAQQTVDALGHTEAVDAAVAATCTTTGLTEGKHCSVCNEVLVAQQTVDALGHTEVVDAAVAATSATTGLTEGKHCSACGEVFVAQEEIPMLTVNINGTGTYVFEAENLDQTHLVPAPGHANVKFEYPTQADPLTSNGASIGACGGGYTTITFVLEEKATVQIYGRLAHAHGGEASKYMTVMLGRGMLESTASLPAGNSNSQYWNWADISFGGALDLEAGTYTITIRFNSNPNLDCFKFEALTYGEFAEKKADLVIDGDGKYTYEAEKVDKSSLVIRQDFINQNKYTFTENWNNDFGTGVCLMGYTDGSVIRFYVDVKEAGKLALSMRMSYASGATYDFSGTIISFAGQTLTPTQAGDFGMRNNTDWWYWVDVDLGQVEVEAGLHVFEINIAKGDNHNIDYFSFVTVNEDVPACESICTTCGLCTDANCLQLDHLSKCEGHQVVVTPDITINDTSDSYKVEAEKLDMSTLVPQTGFAKPVEESFDGGKGLGGIGSGGYQSFIVTTEKDVKVNLYISFANAGGGSILSFIPAVSVNDQPLSLIDSQVPTGIGSPQESPSNFYWNVSKVHIAVVELKAGETYTFKISVNSGNLDGYVLEVIEVASVHECESICTACGKCTDAECAEAACESKCAGHAIDATISTDDVAVTLEGESWNYADDTIVTRSDFISILGWAQGEIRSEAGNGATCVYGFIAGTKFVLNIEAASDMTVDLLLRGATDTAGYDVASKLAVTVNGKSVSGGYGSLTGSGDKSYWDWQTVCLGKIDLVKGVNEITITVLDGHPNIDWVRLVPVDADITVATSGSTTLHMENFDEHKSSIDSKDDFVNVYAGQGFKEGDVFKNPGLGRIYGFNASTFVMHVEVQEACTLNISVNLWNCNALNTYKYYFNGQAINCTNETAPTGAGVYEIGSVTVSEAGIYTFIFTTGGVDFDEVIFTVVE